MKKFTKEHKLNIGKSVRKIKLSKDEFKKIFYKFEGDTKLLSKYFNVCIETIYKYCKNYNIIYKKSEKINSILTKNVLIDLYVNKNYSLNDIEKIFNIYKVGIKKRLKEFDINIRNRSESMISYHIKRKGK